MKREDADIRLAIVPFLQTESDLQLAFVHEKQKENEAALMNGVPGFVPGASVYKTRYMDAMRAHMGRARDRFGTGRSPVSQG